MRAFGQSPNLISGALVRSMYWRRRAKGRAPLMKAGPVANPRLRMAIWEVTSAANWLTRKKRVDDPLSL